MPPLEGLLIKIKGTNYPEPQVVIPPPKKSTTKKQPRTKKAGARPKSRPTSSQGSDGGSSDESELEAPDEPSPIPPTRPTEPKAAVEFDTLQAVWSSRNKRPTAEKVKGALVAFKDVIKTLRDAWKEQVQAMKLAENQGDNDKAAKLKQDVALQRQMMDKIITTTLNMGHPMIVEKYVLPYCTFPPTLTAHGGHGYRCLRHMENIVHVISFDWTSNVSLSRRLRVRVMLCAPIQIRISEYDFPQKMQRQTLKGQENSSHENVQICFRKSSLARADGKNLLLLDDCHVIQSRYSPSTLLCQLTNRFIL